MQFGGTNLYVKLVLMTIKIQLYFWKKKQPQDLSRVVLGEKKSAKTAFILEKHIYGAIIFVSAVYVCRGVLNQLTVLFTGSYLVSPILKVSESTLVMSVLNVGNSSGFLLRSTA